jgi:hypothetical protein
MKILKKQLRVGTVMNFLIHNFTEGEKMRIDLALLFTWRQIQVKELYQLQSLDIG